MPSNILMPALSPTMEKGNLAKWLKKEGDTIKSGDVLAEIETDKATMEVEAVDEGVLARIVVPDGTADVAVNDVIGVILGQGEEPGALDATPAGAPADAPKPAPAPQKPEPEAATPKAEPAPKTEPVAKAEPVAAAPQPAKSAAEPQPAKSAGAVGESGRIFASPLARRLAKEAGVDLARISGSGPHGRVIERDVKAASSGAAPTSAAAVAAPAPEKPAPQKPVADKPAAAPLAQGMADETIKKFFASGSFEEIPHDSMRRTIARRLVEAKQTIPHFYLTLDCELDALLALREEINRAAPVSKEGKPAYKVSVNDFVIKALALALIHVPDANVTWTEGTMLKHRDADVGVAVSIPGGLITPVVRRANAKTLSVISTEMKDYAARAKSRKLKPEEYQGGMTAVSNLGMFGVKDFAAVINPPHATILAVGAGEKRVVVKGNAPAVATIMSVTLSTDHRAVDGALGAQLLQAFKILIEKPIAMLV